MKISKSQLLALLKEEVEQVQQRVNVDDDRAIKDIEDMVLENINAIIENVADYWISLREEDQDWKKTVDKAAVELERSIPTEKILEIIRDIENRLQI